jgi:hypothetical protein
VAVGVVVVDTTLELLALEVLEVVVLVGQTQLEERQELPTRVVGAVLVAQTHLQDQQEATAALA